MTVDAARLTAIRYGKPSFSSTLMPCSTKNSSLDRRSISALPRSFQVAGSVTTGASLVALAAAVAVASAMRCSSSVMAGVGSGVGSAAGSCAGVGLGCTVSGAGVRLRPETTRKQPNETAASTAKQRMPVSSALRRAAAFRAARRAAARRACCGVCGGFGCWLCGAALRRDGSGRWFGMAVSPFGKFEVYLIHHGYIKISGDF